ncbi:MAG: hypothetical protein AAFX05_05775, partial [Planctomycetota bacterium]
MSRLRMFSFVAAMLLAPTSFAGPGVFVEMSEREASLQRTRTCVIATWLDLPDSSHRCSASGSG